MLTVSLLFVPDTKLERFDEYQVQATHFIVYRNAVNQYTLNTPGITGIIANSRLVFPVTWNLSAYPWKNRVDAGVVYVYGEAPPETINKVDQILESAAIGIKKSGKLWSPHEGVVTALPSWIPDGNLVSAIML